LEIVPQHVPFYPAIAQLQVPSFEVSAALQCLQLGRYRTSRTEHTTDPWASLVTAVINLSFQQLRLLDPLSHKMP